MSSNTKVSYSVIMDIAELIIKNRNPIGIQAEILLTTIMVNADQEMAYEAFKILHYSTLELCPDTITEINAYIDRRVSP